MRHLLACLITAALAATASVAQSAGSVSPASPPRPSHIQAHAGAPPAALLEPLEGKDAQVLKGFSPVAEALIADKLAKVALNQRVLRIAVGEVEGRKAALVKFQAGHQLTGQIRLSEIEADAAAALDAVFSTDPAIGHLDIWSVVPSEANAGGQSHRPVFSVGTDRQTYRLVSGSGKADSELVRALGVVRYDPLVLDYAPDNPARDASLTPLPATAYTQPRIGYGTQWQQALSRQTSRAELGGEEPPIRVMRHGDRRRPLVAITIDDGPCPLLTPLVLQVLAQERAVANFFVVGEKAEQYPQLVRDIARAGHLIGNHSYNNERLSDLPPEEIAPTLDACQVVVGRLTGQVMRYLRPPGGRYTKPVLRYIQAHAQTIVLWTHNAADWGNPPVSDIVQRCLTNVHPGSIILMHGGDLNSVRALPLIIRRLRRRGLEPALLSQMHGPGTPQLLTLDAALHLPQNGWHPDKVD